LFLALFIVQSQNTNSSFYERPVRPNDFSVYGFEILNAPLSVRMLNFRYNEITPSHSYADSQAYNPLEQPVWLFVAHGAQIIGHFCEFCLKISCPLYDVKFQALVNVIHFH
jgi:hypothetical protein